ncbi:MAG: sulfatase-like hydrolase/transferase [Chloroflexota bacterium]
MSETVHRGVIGRTYHTSVPWWPEPVSASPGAPNVVIVLLDDVGFAHFGCYGSSIKTPSLDRLAAGGLRYTNFHTTAMCSPTRASLLSGRNHHAAGLGVVCEYATGFPGYRGRLDKRAGTLAEMLRPHGYNTMAVGKWHLMPLRDASAAGPFDYWPQQRGFDRWYGFATGYTDQWNPELYDGNQPVDKPSRPGYHLTEDLTDRAISYVRDQKSAAPEKPFFLYVAYGACHWPHQAPAEYINRYRGQFDAGWDATREAWLVRQKELGIVPADTPLAPRDPDVPAWDSLTADEKRVYARQMEVYAGFMEHTDAQIGRLADYLEGIAQLENTVFIVMSDNGASDEGGRNGSVNVYRQYMQGDGEELQTGLANLEHLGSEYTNPHYPTGWAQVGNTPLKWYKKDTHGGGVRDPLIVHWPRGIAARGELRHQYHHVTDVVPTVLDLVGIDPPSQINGVAQMPIHGDSLAYSFGDATAPTPKETQYFEMIGDRALWHRGWKAVARHTPGTDFDDDRWELYHLDEDYGESRDLAAEQPDKLRELIERWWAEAGKHNVLPLDDRSGAPRVSWGGPVNSTTRYTYHQGMARIDRANAANTTNRSYSIEAEIEVPTGGADGVLLACGSRFGGYVLYVKDERPTFEYNYGGMAVDQRYVIRSAERLGPGRHSIRFDLAKTGEHQGEGTLSVDGRAVATGTFPRTWRIPMPQGGLHCGRDDGSPVSDGYESPFPFTGSITRVTVDLADDQRRDFDAEHRAVMASD